MDITQITETSKGKQLTKLQEQILKYKKGIYWKSFGEWRYKRVLKNCFTGLKLEKWRGTKKLSLNLLLNGANGKKWIWAYNNLNTNQ